MTPARQLANQKLLQQAVVLHRSGRIPEAKALYRKVLHRDARQPDALNLLGVVHLAEGDFGSAVARLCEASAIRPNDASIASNLGNAYWKAHHLEEAERAYRKAVMADPAFALAYVNLGLLLTDAGRLSEAIAILQRAVALDPRLNEGRLGLAAAYERAGRREEAERGYRAIVAEHPTHAPAATALALLLADLDRFAEAATWHEAALSAAPSEADHMSAYGRSCYRQGDVARSISLFVQALELEPRSAQTWNDLGRAHRAQGELGEAASCFEKAIALDPRHADAHRNMVLINRAPPRLDPAAAFAGILSDERSSAQDRIAAGFGLGKLMDDRGQFDEAFQSYQRANALVEASERAAGRVFDLAAFHTTVEHAMSARRGTILAPSASETPVFIVGMPRSGTSLVEQIVASHPAVHGAGELRHVGKLSAALSGTAAERCDVAARHVAFLQSLAPGAIRIVDKMPENVWHLQTIEALFPNARVIFCHRDRRDTCLSCYFQLFTWGNLFSYDLANCGHQHLGIDRVMEHAKATTSLKWMSVAYEHVVDDVEGESRRLLEFLGVPWDPACLEFYKTKRSVRTASGWQVRQEIFKSSLGRWMHYAAHLGSLTDVLGAEDARKTSALPVGFGGAVTGDPSRLR